MLWCLSVVMGSEQTTQKISDRRQYLKRTLRIHRVGSIPTLTTILGHGRNPVPLFLNFMELCSVGILVFMKPNSSVYSSAPASPDGPTILESHRYGHDTDLPVLLPGAGRSSTSDPP